MINILIQQTKSLRPQRVIGRPEAERCPRYTNNRRAWSNVTVEITPGRDTNQASYTNSSALPY